ncbi:MAG: protein kinase [Deltaproteobacteria bacterium]|nr:protein kinase [Deltaproteobacteria bacterium]
MTSPLTSSSPSRPPGIPERFTLERKLGQGSFGAVYVAWDHVGQQRLALKHLARSDSAAIYRFKQEFRALAGIAHPHLVRLHELFCGDDAWCFTMDLVEGTRFDDWTSRSPRERDETSRSLASTEPGNEERPVTVSFDEALAPHVQTLDSGLPTAMAERGFDEARLRAALAGLTAGVLGLHELGILHRDLKPSNVLVHDGHAVILDFGLVATGVTDAHQSADGALTGTPAYMSPEQARGAPITTASDWYAVGVMLYEALTGQLPFVGTTNDMLAARLSRDPRDPRTLCQGLPNDLCDLTMRLLQRDPTARPSAAEIARALGAKGPTPGALSSVAGTFVGRQEAMAKLREGFLLSRAGQTVVAHVRGSSGYGKTTLVRRFLSALALYEDVVVLEGRCYQRESVPFKAMDDLVDALGRYLRRLRPLEAAGLLPRDVRALVRLFPALGRLEIMRDLPGRPASPDPHELRLRAFGALRETFARLTDTRGLILFIDDVQWGDADSAMLLRNLLAPPDVPPLMLVVGYRGGDAQNDNEMLRVLRSPRESDKAWTNIELDVGPLPPYDASTLALSLLGDVPDAAEHAVTIARESGGSPLFVSELVLALLAGRTSSTDVSLQKVLGARITKLPAEARSTLDCLACSERPLSVPELEAVTKLGTKSLNDSLDRLRDDHLVVSTGTSETVAFELLHDKVRSAITEAMSPTVASQMHFELARALEQGGSSDPETLAHHYRAAGQNARALELTERAADRASQALALDHAVDLYNVCLSLCTSDEGKRRVTRKLAQALSNAGRGVEAGQHLLTLAITSDVATSQSLRREAAEEFLRSGHVAEAMPLFGQVLEQEGLAPPRTAGRALASLLWNRAKLKTRGFKFNPKAEADCDSKDLSRIDSCLTLGLGLAGIDLVRSANYHAQSLLLALQTGERYRVARALSISAILKSLESAEGVAIAQVWAGRAKDIAQASNSNHAIGLASAAQGVVAWGLSDLPNCVHHIDEAIAKIREGGRESFREVGSLEVWFALHSLFLMGDLGKVAERGPACVREAEARGDRYTTSTARAYTMPLLWASRDRVDEGRKESDAAIAVWPADVWYHQHWARLRAQSFLDLYEGAGERALPRLERHRADMKRAMQLRIRTLRFEMNYLTGRALLDEGLQRSSPPSPSQIKAVTTIITNLHTERSGLASAYALGLEAGLSALAKTPPVALAAFDKAATAFDAMKMPMHASAARERMGRLLGGDEGRRLQQEASANLLERGVVRPEGFMNLLVPRLPM